MVQNSPSAAPVDGSPAPESNPGTAGLSQVLITAKEDGSFEVQPMTDGQPTGDATQAASIDEAMQGASDALGAVPGASGEAEAAPAEAASDEAGSSPDEAALADEKARYAQKRGTRPKTKPDWGDYMTGGNPTAQ